MLKRTYDVEEVDKVMAPYLQNLDGFESSEWLSDLGNIAISDNQGNLCLFEKESDGVYVGHYFFNIARGKAAVQLSQKVLEKVFTVYKVNVVKGLTPVEKVAARWLSRTLGFTSYGIVDTRKGPCELFILTKKEWENTNG